MANPLVIAYHLVWTAYGWWLPNDPRGSTLQVIRSDLVADLGKLHHGRQRIQPAGDAIRDFYSAAKTWLRHDLLTISGPCEVALAQGFAQAIADGQYTCYACAIMSDHVHLLIRKHRDSAQEMIARLQAVSRIRLCDSGLRPPEHPVWGGSGWKVFLDHPDEIQRTIQYIEQNPVKARRRRQDWPFVVPYDGWPLQPGHNPNSLYVQMLRKVGRYP